MSVRLFTLTKEQDAQNEELVRRMSPLNFRGGFNELISWTKATRPVKPSFNIIGLNTDTGRVEYWDGIKYNVIGNFNFQRIFKSGTYNVQAEDVYLAADTNTAVVTFNLPRAAFVGNGKIYFFKDAIGKANVNNINIMPYSGDTIDLAAGTLTLNKKFAALFLVSDGNSNWEMN